MKADKEIEPHVFQTPKGYEYAEWTFTIHCGAESREEAADLIHEAMSELESALIAAKIKGPAIHGSGIPGPKARAKYDAAREAGSTS